MASAAINYDADNPSRRLFSTSTSVPMPFSQNSTSIPSTSYLLNSSIQLIATSLISHLHHRNRTFINNSNNNNNDQHSHLQQQYYATTSTTPAGQSAVVEIAPAAGAGDPFELDGAGELVKPEMLTSDWIEMILLIVLLVIGFPLNAIALTRLIDAWRNSGSARTKQEVTRTSFLWLKIHLTVIDLIVITCYCPSHIAWLISYTWPGGELLCKGMQYSWDFCFHLMSFGVVGIAVDRLKTVYSLMQLEKTGRHMFRMSKQLIFVRRLIIWCYIGAAIFSIPQWFVWTTIDMRTWSQCTTTWHKLRALQYLENKEFTESFDGERAYTLVHLMTVFWLPFLVLFIAYCYIIVHLFYYSISIGSLIRNSSTTTAKTAADVESSSDDSINESLSLWKQPSVKVPPTSCANSTTIFKPEVIPAWRAEMRSRMFHATVHVIAAYLVCWMPYNVLTLATFFAGELQILISTHLELLRVCVLLNTLLNPFIYGFRSVVTSH